MINRRSIFKFIPAMIAAAVLPKAWTARAEEPSVGHVTLYEGMIHSSPFALISETGPEVIRTISSNRSTTITNSTDGWGKNLWMDGPIRVFVDDPDGFVTEIKNVVSASVTLK